MIIQRYIFRSLLQNLFLATLTFLMLFLVVDFFDRIDNILKEDTASFGLVFSYFGLKIPQLVNTVLPIGMLVGTLLTIGLLSRSNELTAMRAGGMSINRLILPVIYTGAVLSVLSLILGETVVPHTHRRVKEIYNIDIKKKDQRGSYSQKDFWWRGDNSFYSVALFDSRKNQLLELREFEVDQEFRPDSNTYASHVDWIDQLRSWNMKNVTEFENLKQTQPVQQDFDALPLQIKLGPEDFFSVKTDPRSLSFFQLKDFIVQQESYGLNAAAYRTDLYAKVSFPFVILLVPLAVIPFAIRSSRSGNIAGGVFAALIIGFSYYTVHSLSLAFGRAEIWSPMLSAWMANFVLASIAFVLLLGAEAPE